MKLSSSALSRPVACLALAAALALGLVACGSDGDEPTGETVAIGSIFSTTGDGVAFGPQQVKGAQLAVDQINEDDGIDGAELTLTQRDDASDPATSARMMETLIEQDQVLAVLGPTFSNSAAEADPLANELGTPVLAVSNTGPGIVGDCDYPCDFIFRDSLGEATAIPANVENFVARENPDFAKVIFPRGDPFGRTSARTAASAFREAGVEVTLLPAAHNGMVAGLTNERNDVFMITASSAETAAVIVKSLRALERDLPGFTPILGGNAFNSPLASKSLGREGAGIQSAAAWFAGNASEENQEFIAAYREKYGEAPDQFAAQAYTGVLLLAAAAEEADLAFDDVPGDRERLKSALEGVEEETPLGEFRFTPDHDVIQPIWIVAMDGKGGYTLVEERAP